MTAQPGIEDTDAQECAEDADTLRVRWRSSADACFDRGALVRARQFYLKLLALASEDGWCQYQLGRIDSQQGRWLDAVKRFDAALKKDGTSVWTHFEKANALAHLTADPKEIAEEFVSFVRGSPEGVKELHKTAILRNAHVAFNAGLHKEACALYDWLAQDDWLAQSGQDEYICNLRRAKLRLENNDPLSALRIVRKLQSHEDSEFRAHILKGRALLALDRVGDALASLKFVVAQAPNNINVVRVLFAAFERVPGSIELRNPEKFVRGLPHEQRFEFLLRARIACEDYEGAAKLCAEYSAAVIAPHARLIARAMHAAIRKQDFTTSDALFEAAGGVGSNVPHLVAVQILSRLLRKQFEEAERLLQSSEQLLIETGDPDLRHRKLEYLCLRMQLDEASTFLTDWETESELPDTVTAIVASLYSARREWNNVLEFLRECISRDRQIANDALLNAVARAARFTGRYAEVLELLQEFALRGPDKKLSDFCDRLLCEYLLVADLGESEPVAARFSTDVIANPFFAQRAKALSLSLSDRQRSDVEGNIYFCSDVNYLVGTSVALFSLLQNNFSIRERFAVSVVCEDGILDFARDICERIGSAFSVPIRMLAASTLLGTAGDFKSEWGLFTPGHGLSDAAYYRIFAARQLLAEGARGRALYIDSDTCVGCGVEQILNFDLKGHPLGARPEASLPEIEQAAVRLGIEPAKYFNSGVLLFDLDHPELSAALARAVEISTRQKELLTYVDQCALNLAFHELNTALPDTFNWFLRESTHVEEIPPDPVILHFLARPKPWDPMYEAVHCTRWIRKFLDLAELLTPEMRKRLFASQFAQVSAPAEPVTENSRTVPSSA